MSDSVLNTLSQVIEQRKNASAESSYVASLHKGGLMKSLKKWARNQQKLYWPPKIRAERQ